LAIKIEPRDESRRRTPLRSPVKRGPEPLAGHNIIDTSDIDDAQQAMCKTYLPLQLHARPRSARLNMRLNAITVGRARIGYVRFSADVRIVTEEAANYHLNIPLSGRSRSRAGNRDEVVSAPGTAVVYMPGEPVELCWTSGIQQRCLMLGKVTLEREVTYLLGGELRKPLTFAETLNLRGTAATACLQTLRLIDHEAQRESGLLHHPLIAQRLEQLLIDGLLFGCPHNYSEQLTVEQPARDRPIKQAIDLLQGRPEHPWVTSELAAEVRVSARVLQLGFRRLTGRAPMAYLEFVRLQRAHDDLALADPRHTTVSHVAHHWGFLHLGRFAGTYQRRYGEPPSQTLRKFD
jgi:AraC-like DNA-binding protein